MKRVILIAALAACFAIPVGAQTEPPAGAQVPAGVQTPAAPLPAVETLNCEQMQAEMVGAGQLMNQQMDPNLATDVQEMQDAQAGRMREAQAGMVGAGLVCAVPGLGMACAAAQQAQIAQQMSHVDEDRARQEHIVGTVTNSMAGIDQARMMAISDRFESQHCPAPH